MPQTPTPTHPVNFENYRYASSTGLEAKTGIATGPRLQIDNDGSIRFENTYRADDGYMYFRRINIGEYSNTATINKVGQNAHETLEIDVPAPLLQRFRTLVGNDAQDRVWRPEEIEAARQLGEEIFALVTPATAAAQEAAATRAEEAERNAPINFETQTNTYDGVSQTSRTARTPDLLDSASLTVDSDGAVHYGESKFGDDDVSRDTSLTILPDNSAVITVMETSDRGTKTNSFELTADQARTIREELSGQARDNIWTSEEVSRADSLTAPIFERAAQMARDGGGRETP